MKTFKQWNEEVDPERARSADADLGYVKRYADELHKMLIDFDEQDVVDITSVHKTLQGVYVRVLDRMLKR